LSMHGGYVLRGFLGAHIGLFAAIMVGLVTIDFVYSDTRWFHWPLLGWGIVVAGHALLAGRIGGYLARTGAAAGPDLHLPLIEAAPEVTSEDDAENSRIAVNVEMRRVVVDGRDVELTPKEFEVLVLLSQHPGRPFSRAELLDRIWKNDYEVTDRTVDACIVRLRKKLGPQAEAIQ